MLMLHESFDVFPLSLGIFVQEIHQFVVLILGLLELFK